MTRSYIAFTLFALWFSSAFADSVPSIQVLGTTTPLSSDFLKSLPRSSVTLSASERAPETTFKGVMLRDLLSKVNVPSGTNLKGKYISWIVCFDANDGYKAVFSLAELDPIFLDHKVLLADTKDEKALSPQDGPLRLIIPDEHRHARWIKQINKITVGPAIMMAEQGAAANP